MAEFTTITSPPTNITFENSRLGVSYTSNTWSGSTWRFVDGSLPTILFAMLPFARYVFSNFTTATTPPSNITDPQSRTEAHYSGNTWNMGGVWGIKEGVSRPTILRVSGTAIVDPALTSRKVYVFVEEDETGSLFYNGKIYKSLRKSESFDSVVGVNGAFITHYYGGDMLEDSEGNRFNFLFSGVQDPARPGGYGDIQELTSRRVAFRTDRSNNVVFYYGMLPPLAYDAMAHVSTPTGVMNLALYLTEKSNIRIKLDSGNIMTAGITLPTSTDATKLRVMTASGIRAFQDGLKTVGTGEPTQGEIDLSNEQGSDYEPPPPHPTPGYEDFMDDNYAFEFTQGTYPFNRFSDTAPNGKLGYMKSSNQGVNGSTSEITFIIPIPTDNTSHWLEVDWYVSSEGSYDKIYMTIDGNPTNSYGGGYTASGNQGGMLTTKTITPLSAGNHALKIQFTKDSSGNTGTDSAYITRIEVKKA